MALNPDYLLSLIVAFFTSWQVKALAGLIVLDLVLGVASALRRGEFDLGKLAEFYRSSVLPYMLGYLAFFVAVGYIIPPDSLGDIGEPVNEAAVTLAWLTLVGTLVKSIASNFAELYQQQG
jgi:hypothetical protein